MKASAKSNFLPLLAMSAGVVCAVLRSILYATGFDDRGLMSSFHPLHIACVVIAAVFAGYAALYLRKQDDSASCEESAPNPRKWAGAAILIPLWFLTSAFSTLDQVTDKLTAARAALAFAAVICLAVTCWCRVQGKRTNFLLHGLLCVFFAVDMICRYRPWSGNPQLPDYTFPLLACIFLTLTAYYRVAFDVELPSPRIFRFCSVMAIFFCVSVFSRTEDVSFYIAGALWAAFGLLAPKPTAPEPEPPIQEEE